tara:strand:+ start:14367 stop:15755 length:1389 start_codon:yes stop_codon:yes gene_type:complete
MSNDKYNFCTTIERLDISDINVEAINYAKYDLIDILGVIIAGKNAPGINQLVTLHSEWQGQPQSSVLCRDLKLPAPSAALINGAMAHALDFDDTLDFAGNIHVGASVVPAALAMAEQTGGVTGAQLLTAIASGIEMSCRLAAIAHEDLGWHRTGAFGIFGATVAACKVLGLDAPLIQQALGIALSQASGTRQCILDGALTKRLQAGFAASNAVTAALYAQAGLTGAQDPLWGRYGFFEMYQPNGYDTSKGLEDFGTMYLMTDLSFKPYPCGRPTHKFISASLKAHADINSHRLKIEDISAIKLKCGSEIFERHKHNSDSLHPPQNQIEAQFHVGFLIASSLIHGRFGLHQLDDLANKQVVQLTRMIEWEPHPTNYQNDLIGHLELTVNNNEKMIVEVTQSSVVQSPSTISNLIYEKFRSCLEYGLGFDKTEQAQEFLGQLSAVETLANSSEITNTVLNLIEG